MCKLPRPSGTSKSLNSCSYRGPQIKAPVPTVGHWLQHSSAKLNILLVFIQEKFAYVGSF